MGLVTRICRCIPGFSILLWVVIAYLALGDRIPSWFASSHTNESVKSVKHPYGDLHHLTISQGIYILYSVVIHILACFAFPVRLIWSIWHLTDEVKTAKFEAAEEYAETEFSDDKSSQHSLSVKSVGGTESSISRVGTPKIPGLVETPESVVHAIILPSYKEDIDTLRETLAVLASHVLAKSNYDVSICACGDHHTPHRCTYSGLTSFLSPDLSCNGTTGPRCRIDCHTTHSCLCYFLPQHLLYPPSGRHLRRGCWQEQQCKLGGTSAKPQLRRQR